MAARVGADKSKDETLAETAVLAEIAALAEIAVLEISTATSIIADAANSLTS